MKKKNVKHILWPELARVFEIQDNGFVNFKASVKRMSYNDGFIADA